MEYQVVIRGGTIVDGLGGDPYVGDVAVSNGLIAAVGEVKGAGAREIDATGLLVTPGFIDLHTHYDGQAIWSDRLNPSSGHGVTTAVMGNCGVGFAPCRPEDHDVLVDVMAGVEDIPDVVMVEGLPWDWETFPQYLDAVDSRPRDIDVAPLLPHSPLRVYVMGQRGADREAATPEDLARMRELAREAVEAGALGFASSHTGFHRTESGAQIPSYQAGREELQAIGAGVADAGGGLMQISAPDALEGDFEAAMRPVFEAAGATGLNVTYTLPIDNGGRTNWAGVLSLGEEYQAKGVSITAQLFPRPIGMILGLELSANPFVTYPSYRTIADLPLEERVAEMRKPDVRARILAEGPTDGHPLLYLLNWQWMFAFDEETPNYEPDPSRSILALAKARGVSPEEEAYDRLLAQDGHAMLFSALGNFLDNSLDTVGELLRRDDVVLGLGDGGAHYGMICDASFTTFVLTHWTRDRATGRYTIPTAVRELTSAPASVAGLEDRGRIAVGYKADLNVIDYDGLRLHMPEVVHDLPAGGMRLDQRADGYVATLVSGEVIAEHSKPTSARPGKLVRGRRNAPAAAE
ncbi:amidohydrolase family protein [Streptomyces sp. NPDC001027]|uniref:N-acyl-D-amino-acid deacylase family protein n=1 Tax=Streptomyces sp. NPDC001027 TaxID=3154771 RepID=UPI0033314BE3